MPTLYVDVILKETKLLCLVSLHHRQVRADGKDKNSVVSFTLTDEPQHIDLQTSNSKDEVRIPRAFSGL